MKKIKGIKGIKGGLDPKITPAISYCKNHEFFINLQPHCASGISGCGDVYFVVCPDCGKTNIKGKFKHPLTAIKNWNKKMGVCLT